MPLKAKFSIVLMGPAGSGKSTIGRLIAEETGASFIESDEFHSEAALRKMAGGQALDDADRGPWLESLSEELRRRNEDGEDVILACSALKETYREVLKKAGRQVVFVYLKGDRELLEKRLNGRQGHFFPSHLLDSQLETLEEPCDALTLDIHSPPEQLADQIIVPFFNRPPRF